MCTNGAICVPMVLFVYLWCCLCTCGAICVPVVLCVYLYGAIYVPMVQGTP